MYENVHESRSIGQFLLKNARNWPREATLLDSFDWKMQGTDREKRSIGQFLLKNAPKCPREATLLDSSNW